MKLLSLIICSIICLSSNSQSLKLSSGDTSINYRNIVKPQKEPGIYLVSVKKISGILRGKICCEYFDGHGWRERYSTPILNISEFNIVFKLELGDRIRYAPDNDAIQASIMKIFKRPNF